MSQLSRNFLSPGGICLLAQGATGPGDPDTMRGARLVYKSSMPTLDLVDHRLQTPAVFDVIPGHGLFGSCLGLRVVEDHNHVRFDRNAGVIPALEGVRQNLAHATVSLAGPMIIVVG